MQLLQNTSRKITKHTTSKKELKHIPCSPAKFIFMDVSPISRCITVNAGTVAL